MIDLDDVYDPTTMGEIDGWPSRTGRASAGGVRGSALAGALLLAGLTGAREAMQQTRPAIAEVRPDPGLDTDDPVTVLFVPDGAAATVAVIRPWRFPQAG